MSPCVSSGTQPEVHLTKYRASWKHTSNNQFRLERARPKKDVFETAMFEEKYFFKKMTSKVPEIKLVKSYCSNRNIHRWSGILLINLYCLFLKSHSVTTIITGLKEKEQVDEFLLFVKLYFSSTFNYAQLSYNNLNKKFSCSAIISSQPTSKKVAPCVSSRTHPKSSTKYVEKSYEPLEILRGRAQNRCFH